MVQNLAVSIPNIDYDSNNSSRESHPPSEVSEVNPFAEIPLTALSRNTRRQLSNSLNSKKILRSEEGYERDWRGLASLSQQKNFCDEQTLSGADAMSTVLHLWSINNPQTATVANLALYLGIIDRWDVSDDIYENLLEDVKNYNIQLNRKTLNLDDVTDSSAYAQSGSLTNGYVGEAPDHSHGHGSDPNILTKDDVLRAQKGLPPQKYDAFVLFAEADINYVGEMITKLEDNADYKFKLCLKDRDLLAGVPFAFEALSQLIEERCKHLIVILTKEFMKSPENKFLVNYTQFSQIENKTRKIIPLLYEETLIIPGTLKIYTHLKYNATANSPGLFNFWFKLAASIRDVSLPAPALCETPSPPPIYLNENCSGLIASRQRNASRTCLATLPSPPAEIPSININGHAFIPEDEKPQKKERNKYKKRNSLRVTSNGSRVHQLTAERLTLRNAHSTSQLNAGAFCNDMSASTSDLSTHSGYSETTKKKRRTFTKFFRKVFTRSTTKLHEPA